MNKKSLVSINDYSKSKIIKILRKAEESEKNPDRQILNNKVVSLLFLEPSTRTKLSFETATLRLGGKVINFNNSSSSMEKGESLKDTLKMIGNYSNLIVIRHPLEGSAMYASEISKVPIINAGDGANQHPTQTLLDLYSIFKTQNTLENINIFIVGDLKYGRAVHSLIMALSHFAPTFNFVSPQQLRLPNEYKHFLKKKNIKFHEHSEINDTIINADILYMTRIQKERFSDLIEYEKIKNTYLLKNEMLKGTKDTMRILHPLPRVNEIDEEIDENPKAYYFEQALNGLYVRQAIIMDILGYN